MRAAWSLVLVIMVVAVSGLIGGCRSAPPVPAPAVEIDPLAMARLGGLAAVRTALLFERVDEADLRLARPVVEDAWCVLAAGPAERPAVIADVLVDRLEAEVGIESTDALFTRAALADLISAFRVDEATAAEVDTERAAAIAAAWLEGVDRAITIALGDGASAEPPRRRWVAWLQPGAV